MECDFEDNSLSTSSASCPSCCSAFMPIRTFLCFVDFKIVCILLSISFNTFKQRIYTRNQLCKLKFRSTPEIGSARHSFGQHQKYAAQVVVSVNPKNRPCKRYFHVNTRNSLRKGSFGQHRKQDVQEIFSGQNRKQDEQEVASVNTENILGKRQFKVNTGSGPYNRQFQVTPEICCAVLTETTSVNTGNKLGKLQIRSTPEIGCIPLLILHSKCPPEYKIIQTCFTYYV